MEIKILVFTDEFGEIFQKFTKYMTHVRSERGGLLRYYRMVLHCDRKLYDDINKNRFGQNEYNQNYNPEFILDFIFCNSNSWYPQYFQNSNLNMIMILCEQSYYTESIVGGQINLYYRIDQLIKKFSFGYGYGVKITIPIFILYQELCEPFLFNHRAQLDFDDFQKMIVSNGNEMCDIIHKKCLNIFNYNILNLTKSFFRSLIRIHYKRQINTQSKSQLNLYSIFKKHPIVDLKIENIKLKTMLLQQHLDPNMLCTVYQYLTCGT